VVEVQSGSTFERRIERREKAGFRPFLRAEAPHSEVLFQHLCAYDAGVKSKRTQSLRRVVSGNSKGCQDVRQLGIAIGLDAVPTVLAVDILPWYVAAGVESRRYPDDPSPLDEKRLQERMKQEGREMVDLPCGLPPIGRCRASREHGPGVMNNARQLVAFAEQVVGENANLRQGGEIGGDSPDNGASRTGAERVGGSFGFLLRSAMEKQGPPGTNQTARCCQTDTVCGTGNQPERLFHEAKISQVPGAVQLPGALVWFTLKR